MPASFWYTIPPIAIEVVSSYKLLKSVERPKIKSTQKHFKVAFNTFLFYTLQMYQYNTTEKVALNESLQFVGNSRKISTLKM